MKTIESVQPSEEVMDRIREVLEEEGPLTHDEIVEGTSIDDSEVQQALNELWRSGDVYHTLDRKYDLEDN